MASDTFSDEKSAGSSTSTAHQLLDDLGNLARSWNHPVDLAMKLRALVVERPWVALSAAVLVGAVLHSRWSKRHAY